jgi:hypothetical protein
MLQLPANLSTQYRPATDREVHSWSFGALRSIRHPGATSWEQQIGTLYDQRIFGPRRDLECACGKYQGPKHRNMICDICGVKVTSPDVRRQRFGHIDLPVSVAHPLGEDAETLSVIPILPATFLDSSGGESLARVYEDLVQACTANSLERIRSGWDRIVELLMPLLTFAHSWDLSEVGTIARGLALELRKAPSQLCDYSS